MKNTLIDLNNHLFKEMKRLNDDDQKEKEKEEKDDGIQSKRQSSNHTERWQR